MSRKQRGIVHADQSGNVGPLALGNLRLRRGWALGSIGVSCALELTICSFELTRREHALIAAEVAMLPVPYLVETEGGGNGVFVIARPSDPLRSFDGPWFMFGRCGTQIACVVRWIDGSILSTADFEAVEDAAGLMASGVFNAACAKAGVSVPSEYHSTAH